MLTSDIIRYYAELLIIQYRQHPKAYATIQTLVAPVIMDQLPIQVQNAFDIDTAMGSQLDVIGKYAGVIRSGYGFHGQSITLDDDDFRSLIQVAIIRNASGSSLSDIQSLLYRYFPREIFVFDGANMQMNYLVSSSVGSQELAQLFVTEGLLPKPMGVQLASLVYLPTLDIFGFSDSDTQNINVFPFNTYEDYNETWHWLDYDDVIILI